MVNRLTDNEELHIAGFLLTTLPLGLTLTLAWMFSWPWWIAWSGWLVVPLLVFVIITAAMIVWSFTGLFYTLPKQAIIRLNRSRTIRREVAERRRDGWPRWSKKTLEDRYSATVIEKMILRGRLVMIRRPATKYDGSIVYIDLPETVMIRGPEEE
jgi:hypothetical protein